MNRERARIAIAEACGWKRVPIPFKVGRETVDWLIWEKDGTRASIITGTLPDYPGNLDEMFEAEQTLTKEEQNAYVAALVNMIVEPAEAEYGPLHLVHADIQWMVAHSTPEQRAYAFCAAKGINDACDCHMRSQHHEPQCPSK